MKRILVRLLTFCAILHFTVAAKAHSPENDMSEAAKSFLASLTLEQKAKATFAVTNNERVNFHFVPRPRAGLPFKDMTPGQHLLGLALLNSALSQRGFLKATTIMSLDEILRELENGRGPTRDSELYYISIFGEPGGHEPWGWRIEGHHLSLNFLIVDGHIAATPSFFGANPAEVRTGPRAGLNVLGAEENLGRELVKSLTPEQREIAIITNVAPREIITGAKRNVSPLSPAGISAAKLTSAQRALLDKLIEEYVRRNRTELADADLKKIRDAGRAKIFFAWAGGVEPGQGHYYRIQGPSFLLEFDNTQNGANHIHTAWRDFANDFGEDLLKRHYDSEPHH